MNGRGERPDDMLEMAAVRFESFLNPPLKSQVNESRVPVGLKETPLGMTNFDHGIDSGFDEVLRAGQHFGRHAARDFNGKVWFADGQFHEEVWVYGDPKTVISAESLHELMDAVNAEYGAS